jgi:hypothetical protein
VPLVSRRNTKIRNHASSLSKTPDHSKPLGTTLSDLLPGSRTGLNCFTDRGGSTITVWQAGAISRETMLIFRPAGPVDTDFPFLLARRAGSTEGLGSLAVFAMHTAVYGGPPFGEDFRTRFLRSWASPSKPHRRFTARWLTRSPTVWISTSPRAAPSSKATTNPPRARWNQVAASASSRPP